tara:strand:- start:645 stop:1193 length:549 start_codon:yes stop_codon:yes gene_type:complete
MSVEITTITAGKSAKKTIKSGKVTSDFDKPGYGKPPKKYQWKPGQSGNPSGKPKGAKNLATVVKEEAKGKVTIKDASGISKKVSKLEAIVRTTTHKALKGDPKAMALILGLFKEHLPKEMEAGETAVTEEELQILGDHTAMLKLLETLTGAPDPKNPSNEKPMGMNETNENATPANKGGSNG